MCVWCFAKVEALFWMHADKLAPIAFNGSGESI